MSVGGRRIGRTAERLKWKKKAGGAATPTQPLKAECLDKLRTCSRWYFQRAVARLLFLQRQDVWIWGVGNKPTSRHKLRVKENWSSLN